MKTHHKWTYVTEVLLIPLMIGLLSPVLWSRAHVELLAAYRHMDDPPFSALALNVVGWLLLAIAFVVLGLLSQHHKPDAADVITSAIGLVVLCAVFVFWLVRSLTGHATGIEDTLLSLVPATMLIYLVTIVWRSVILFRSRRSARVVQ